jgi:hypothetical protein
MYLDIESVKEAAERLGSFHPFFGITFLVCKKGDIPVGKSIPFPINAAEETFLRAHYKPDVGSNFFYQPFRTSSRSGRWLSPKYPYSGSQTNRTRGDLSLAFIHEKGTDQWGWARGYVGALRAKLETDKSGPIPAFWLAVWLYRDKNWSEGTAPKDVVKHFFRDFSITSEESHSLFATETPRFTPFLSEESFSDRKLLQFIGSAPDAEPDEGGTLKLLRLRGVGPCDPLEFEPADRLSIITGDNGLGKTFLLESAWWGLTGQWAERMAYPNRDEGKKPASISFQIAGPSSEGKVTAISFDYETQRWPAPKGRPTIPGLIIYARVDGSFAVWDPVRHTTMQGGEGNPALLFSNRDVLIGLEGKIEGLLRDWTRWQHSEPVVFETFKSVLRKLSPPDMLPLTPGEPTRMPNEARPIPTLEHNYGTVPFTNESAGVKRVVTLAYLIVWAWNEHKVYSSIAGKQPQTRVVILIDEMEAHLHPKWQRVILPALVDVTSILSSEIQPQMIIATHSPLVLASVETIFSDTTDKLFHLELRDETRRVSFRQIPFVPYGRIDRWLTSDLFELRQARSQEAEKAIEDARKIMESPGPQKEEIRMASHALVRSALPPNDEFWARWTYFAEKNGVEL